MIRIYLSFLLSSDKEVFLNPMQQHYLKTVMRKKSGAELLVFNEQDGEWSAIFQKKSVLVKEKLREPEERSKKYLAIGCIKQNRLEIIVEKATEIGIDVIFLLQTARSNSREANLNRLKSISIEATEQSGRIRPLMIEKPQEIGKFLQIGLRLAFLHPEISEMEIDLKNKNELSTVECNISRASMNQGEEQGAGITTPKGKSYIGEGTAGRVEAIAEMMSNEREVSRQKSQKEIDCLIIGPEGGFSPDELRLLDNLERISLGKNILRTETASIIAAYLLMSKSSL